MVSNSVEIGNICDLQEGYVNPSQKVPGYFGGGIRWLRAVDLNDAEVFETSRTLSQEGYESAGKSALMFPANSIGISKSGTIGRLGILRKPMCGNRAVINIVPKQSNDLRYIFYSLRMARQSIIAMAVGSVQKNLYVPVLESLTIPWPEQHVRDTIVDIAGSIDDKIAVNTRVNDYLEQACQALFDEFDSDEANPFVTVSDVADVNPKRTIKKGEEALCVEMSDLSTSGSFPSGWRMKPYNGGMKFVNGDTVMARITPCLENGKTGYINFLDDNQTAFGSTEYIVLATKGVLPPEYFYYLARNREFVAYAVAHMNGSSGRQRVSGADIEHYEVRMPTAAQLERFRQVAEPAMKTILANSLESRKLAELRDALLPKLMSGEIDVSQVELPTQPNNHLYVQ